MKIKILFIALFLGYGLLMACTNQTKSNEQEAVLQTVQTLFDAMAEGDSSKAASVFVEGGHTFRVGANGSASLSENADFAETIGNFEQKIVERMWDPQVLVDGNIAMAWTPYELQVNGEFSHCGTNLISLVKNDNDWKITDITYNVRENNCPDGQPGQ